MPGDLWLLRCFFLYCHCNISLNIWKESNGVDLGNTVPRMEPGLGGLVFAETYMLLPSGIVGSFVSI